MILPRDHQFARAALLFRIFVADKHGRPG
jgi:hypothetical protein